ncbi:MAG: hypothetical protein IIC67_02915, partial [Thaumarchaeota archaeon]|nr:hypothetical protein [Nitrososphaerota archaeon]
MAVSTRNIWQDSVYRFRVPVKDETKLQEIFVDVTGSAPTFNEVFDTMTKVFNDLLKSDECRNVTTVLDFGAAKFRNTLFFLKKGKKTSAVEFEKLAKNSNQAKKILKKCENYDNYENVIFPYTFIEHNAKYDLCLLVNVLPVMPVFAERLLVLQVLHEKTNENGHVLWYVQPDGTFYKETRESNKQNLGDGVWLKVDKKYKTFFRYHSRDEVNEMMALSGFEFVRKIPASGNDVMLYKKTKYNLFADIIDPQKILNLIPFDESIKDPQIKPKIVTKKSGIKVVIPNPPELSMKNLYIDALVSFDPGPDYAEHYHRLASQIINRLFRGHLRNMELQQPMDGRNKFIDTIYRNASEKGFFLDSIPADALRDRRKIIHPRLVHRSLYDAEKFGLSQLGVQYLLPIFTDAIGIDDMEFLRSELFNP